MLKRLLPITFVILFIVSCGGGGGGGGTTPTTPTTPAPIVNLSAEPTSVLLENASTLTWSSSNATSADGETESCITITAESDKHFDWITELRFDLTDPSSGEGLARNQFLVRIYNDNSATNTLSGIPGNPGESMPISGSN